jgi:hypothetical protein
VHRQEEVPMPPGNFQKNREMKEGPTMLLITKHLFWEPKMLMKTTKLS